MFPNKFKTNWSLSGCSWAQRPADHLNRMCWRRQTSITCRAADQRRARTEKHTSSWKQRSCWVVKAVQNEFLHNKLRQKDSPKEQSGHERLSDHMSHSVASKYATNKTKSKKQIKALHVIVPRRWFHIFGLIRPFIRTVWVCAVCVWLTPPSLKLQLYHSH